VGLIGGSFALALKQAKACRHVVGAGRSQANLKLAVERGVIDSIEGDAAAAVEGADLVLVAAPVAQYPKIFSQIEKKLKPATLVTDAGSTKRDVVQAAREALKKKIRQFVPAHPIAGAEKSGAAAASAELFRGRRVVITPLPENSEEAILRLNTAWSTCGARTSTMTPEQHDEVFAAVSHLPHLLAYALVHEVTKRKNAGELFSFAAGGFRDFTRIASSNPEMWRDICMANADRLVAEIGRYSKKLAEVKKLLEGGKADALEKLFAEARHAREDWLSKTWSGRRPRD
jgi:prephenate dehydrogenase